ncbi:DUF2975 domain-containing protein [Paenibacillus sp. PL2-23]|uniref:DUF2975 domain-containing protein n=1 Tax=Paenibacillus sp. PL2-23 TaxID=2100729 RepID=UPI0030F757BB
MKRETFILKLVLVLIALPVAALCVWGLPVMAREGADTFTPALFYPIVIAIYVSVVPYFYALLQAYRLLTYMDRNKAFSERSVTALKKIKSCGVAISIVITASMPFLYLVAEKDDAPGLIVMGMVVIFASFVIAVFAAVLQKLLNNAIAIKSENDLTV